MENLLLYSYINDIANRLCEPNIYGFASVMIGAGFSKNAKNLGDQSVSPPDWSQLAGIMFDELYPENIYEDKEKRLEQKIIECHGNNVLTLAQKYEVTFDRIKLNNLIEKSIADDMYVPDELHKKLLELNWNDVFTTNYDTLLERAINQILVKKNYKVVYSQNDLPGSVRPRILKLHGSIGHSENYIITEEDYRTYPTKYTTFVNTVQQSMLETRLCLMGFSGDDPNFLNWLGWLRDNMGENCPKIYLCGLFDNMDPAEIKLLENRSISVVDISSLADKESKNKYYDSYNKFFNILKEKSLYKKKSIIEKKIYSEVSIQSDLKDLRTYYEEMLSYCDKLIEEINMYVCVPKELEKKISQYIKNQLNAVLYDNERLDEKRFELIGKLCYILKRVNTIIYDNHIKKLTEILALYTKDEKRNLCAYFNIIIYLLVLYRIDDNIDEYKKYIDEIHRIENNLSFEMKNEYCIEYSKYLISKLNYEVAEQYIEKISLDIRYEYSLKKACLLGQINKNEKALEILKKCAANLAQEKYSEDKMASLIGYANLSARAIVGYNKDMDSFSDKDYYKNNYNCREIVLKSKEDIVEQCFGEVSKENSTTASFNPNTYTRHFSVGNTDYEKKLEVSFRYILLQDLLCLPIYKDHKNSIKKSIEVIDDTSKSPLWKWIYIARLNDENIIDSYFTRERIYATKLKYVEKFFHDIMRLWKSLSHKCPLYIVEKILSEKTIIDVLSRILVVLDDNRIADFIHILAEISVVCLNSDNNIIFKSIERLKYIVNSNILEMCLDDIFIKFSSRYYIGSYFFEDINYKKINISNTKLYVDNIIKELKNDNMEIRDNAISKVILLNKIENLQVYSEEIADAIWDKVDKNGMPCSKLYLPIVWKNIPHPKNIDFEKLYRKYLLNPNLTRSVCNDTIKPYIFNDEEVYSYLICFNNMTHINGTKGNGVKLESSELLTILNYLYEYVDNEKKRLEGRYDFLGIKTTTKDTFRVIGRLIAFIYLEGNATDKWSEELEEKILQFKKVYKSMSMNLIELDKIKKLRNESIVFDEFENLILSGEKDDICTAFIVLYSMLKVFKNETESSYFKKNLIDFIKKIPYMSTDIANEILIQMTIILRIPIFLEGEQQKVIFKTFDKCYSIYYKEVNNKGKISLNSMYSLSKTLYFYYSWLIENSITPDSEFEKLKSKLKQNKLNEIKSMWN